MPSTDPNRIRIGVRSESERISETDSHLLTDVRTEKSDTAVNQETAVDAGARTEKLTHELQPAPTRDDRPTTQENTHA